MTTAVTSYGMGSMGINAPTMTGVVLAGLVMKIKLDGLNELE